MAKLQLKKPESIIGIDKLTALQHLVVKDGLSRQNIMLFLEEVQHRYSMQPRSIFEDDQTKVHLINYDIITNEDGEVLTYKRPDANNGETLLTGKRSAGIGGHVEGVDAAFNDKRELDLYTTVIHAGQREVDEEVKWALDDGAEPKALSSFGTFFTVQPVGFLIEWDQVGLVHLGVVHEYMVSNRLKVVSGEDQLEDVKFEKPGEIDSTAFEGWSKILLDQYLNAWR